MRSTPTPDPIHTGCTHGPRPSGRTRWRWRRGPANRSRRPSPTGTRRAARPSGRRGVRVRLRRSPSEPGWQRRRRRGRVSMVAGPPSDFNLLDLAHVAPDEVRRGRFGRTAGIQAERQVEAPPPGVHRARSAPVRGAYRREDQRGLRGGGEVPSDLAGIVRVVLVVFVEEDVPRHLLGLQLDGNCSDEPRHRTEDVAGHGTNGAIRGERDPPAPPVAVLDHHLVGVEIESDNQEPRNGPAPARVRSPSRERTTAGRRAGAAVQEATGRPTTYRAAGCGRGRCRRSRSTRHRRVTGSNCSTSATPFLQPTHVGCLCRRVSSVPTPGPGRPRAPDRDDPSP